MTRRRLMLLASLGLVAPVRAAAAGHGSLQVRIVDGEGRPVAGADVLLTLKNTWRKRRARSDDRGEVYFHGAAAEPFRITVEATGFDTTIDTRDCLEIVSGRRLRHTMVLQPLGARARRQERCPTLLPEPGSSLPLAGALELLGSQP